MSRRDVTKMIHGILFPGEVHTQESVDCALKVQFEDTDIVIVSYPRSGTIWTQELVTLITSRGDPHLSQTTPNWARSCWLEQISYEDKSSALSSTPRVRKTHLPYHLLGPALQSSKARVIYVSRNPKDVVVSFYHLHHFLNILTDPESFSEFLDQFLEDKLVYGSWFDHVKGWTGQTAGLNLLHITYEEMKMDLRGTVDRVSSFLQCPLQEEELNSCVEHCSFSSMKNNKMTNCSLVPGRFFDHSKGSFMRKGQIGDWKNVFTLAQNEYFDSVFNSKMEDCSLKFVWEKEEKEEPH